MAGVTSNGAVALVVVALLSLVVPSVRSAVDYGVSAARSYNSGWLPAKATWYGQPNGAGPDDNGGACGFKNVNRYPLSAMTSCGNEPLFQGGAGCGTCYQIRCTRTNNPACSGQTKTVVITDMNYYPVAKYHFDLSGTAFGALAMPGQNDQLRHAGIIDMQFRRVPCNFAGMKLGFYVLRGANPNYLPVLVQYANRDGTVVKMDLMRSTNGRPTGRWEPMYRSWGSVWRCDSRDALLGPLSLRVTSESGKTLVANNVIPNGWKGDTIYSSNIQFS
ncbi:expansin-B2-like [Lolium rigidum]|uniref:expansin-B2-like n=1 Tax=Lolium rigidum TaxID=89674 RepID=UPI001F5C5ACA|nr:expansin-B2-like [Lolium rigidum]